MSVFHNEAKIYPHLHHSAPQEPQVYRLNKISEIEGYFLSETEVREQLLKNETIQYNYWYCRQRPNYIKSDHWGNIYCGIYHWCWIADCPLVLL